MEEKVILCPMCKMHPAIIKIEKSKMSIKDTEVEYDESMYFCSTLGEDDEDAYFIPPKMMDENLLRARNAYRQIKGLLTSDEIVEFRKKFDLSQVELARLLGWGDVTISRYESKAIQDSTYDNELRLIMENPIIMLKMLEKNQSAFESGRYAVIKAKISKFITDAFIKRQNLLNYYALYSQPCNENGYTVLNIDKLEQVINYFAFKVSDLKKVLLMKLLWYSDALSFKRNHIAVTGLVYVHKAMGALPVGHESIMNLSGICVEEEMPDNFDYSIYHILPNNHADFSCLLPEELEILDKVADKFHAYTGKEIAKYMHQEYAYQNTNPNQIIRFTDAEKIKDF